MKEAMNKQAHQSHESPEMEGRQRLSFHDADRDRTRPIDTAIAKINQQRKFAFEDFGALTEIVGVIFGQTGGNGRHKAILDALIGICKGRLDFENDKAKWFTASHEALVDQIKTFDHSISKIQKASQLKRVSRAITGLMKNQSEAGVVWVEYKPGTDDGKWSKHASSAFRLVILEYALDAYNRARDDSTRYQNKGPGSRWQKAALEVVNEIKKASRVIPKSKPKRKRTPHDAWRQVQGSSCSWLKMLMEAGDNPETIANKLAVLCISVLSEVIGDVQERADAARKMADAVVLGWMKFCRETGADDLEIERELQVCYATAFSQVIGDGQADGQEMAA